ncbi:MAG TPA: PepSY-associated TM helix domain-containing protein [Bryobacteraceae bacterium]|jgi:uncharacterized iron-regulated membrane protein
MPPFRRTLRKLLVSLHTWVGLFGGLFVAILAFSGGVVTFRPQIANLLSPPPAQTTNCVPSMDWNRAEKEIEDFAHTRINRIYAPTGADFRYRFRMTTDQDSIFTHVIYDACAAKVLGTANLAWMDWLVDFHHNLRAEKTGRFWAGWIGALLLLSGVGGISIWVISNPSVKKFFRIRSGPFMPRDLHSFTGVLAGCLLIVGSFTSLWLCFPQTMRAALKLVAPLPDDVRAPRLPRPAKDTPRAGLGDIMSAAQDALPDGSIREIRLPETYGNVQVRMWRQGDFRSLGNNVVTVDNVTARVVATNLYEDKGPGDRIVQAMAGIHYGEWGGTLVRSIYGLAGLASALLLVTGFLLWWIPKRRATPRTAKESIPEPESIVSHS